MNHLVIVGGGTAGWLAAIAFNARFPEKKITIVTPEVIAPIGVGESVTGVILEFIQNPLHGLDFHEFVRRCDVTFKAGIWYKDWQGVGTEYLAPIDSPPEYFKHYYESNVEEFYAFAAADGARLGDIQLFSQLMRTCHTDLYRNSNGSVSTDWTRVSCQFDALKVAAFLQQAAVKRANIEYVNDHFESFEQDPTSGMITKIRTKTGREISGDFFFDCTGFHRQLYAKAFPPKWKSYADYIKVDSAIPVFVPFAEDKPLPPYTTAEAMPAGWMWHIPTQTRFGLGYLYSSRHCDLPQAIGHMRAAGIEPGDNPRVIRFEPGRFEQMWQKNVCAIGLAAGFIEPLEATTIHGTYVQIKLLTELFLPFMTPAALPSLARTYNQLIQGAFDDYVEFISCHYHTGRNDTEFWRDYQKPEAIHPNNQARLEKWKHSFPMREDFTPTITQRAWLNTGLVLWAPMIDGLGFSKQEHARRVVQMSLHQQQMRDNVARYIQIRNKIMATALTHREAIKWWEEG